MQAAGAQGSARAVKKHPTCPREDTEKPMAGLAGLIARSNVQGHSAVSGSACPRQDDPEAGRIVCASADHACSRVRKTKLVRKEFVKRALGGTCENDQRPVKISG
jgi:hypothetical protein